MKAEEIIEKVKKFGQCVAERDGLWFIYYKGENEEIEAKVVDKDYALEVIR